MSTLPADLQALADRARDAATELGLDFPEVVFEMLDPDELNMVAAYGGYPVRYPHWRHGMAYRELQKSYEYGLSRIYELVINNDPCYAYLMRTNTRLEQKLVMAHVHGHADFFRNNLRFAPTDRRMIDTMANHATRVRRHIDRLGPERVEEFIDACLSIENLIDPMSLYVRRAGKPEPEPEMDEDRLAAGRVRKFPVPAPYMEPFVNPKAAMETERKQIAEEIRKSRKNLAEPTRDVLEFLLYNAPLQDWQADCLDIVRDEAYYFAPQAMTKIANEGWASFVHTRLMTTRLLDPSEIVEYADRHSGTVVSGPGRLNPYAIGLAIFRDIEDRWNRGAHGRAYRECTDDEARRRWNTGAGEGMRKCLEVRRSCDDLMLIDAYLTAELIDDLKLYTYGRDPGTGKLVILDRDPNSVRQKLLKMLVNGGQPVIELVDANHDNRGEMRLVHRHEQSGLDEGQARETLRSIHRIWTRPVHIDTVVESRIVRWSFDGKADATSDLGKAEPA
ncbi:MAG: SpoVR family protein [Planctomycetes bacterium]|nr:SpoVR family protein [Planctomycetota bacterium]